MLQTTLAWCNAHSDFVVIAAFTAIICTILSIIFPNQNDGGGLDFFGGDGGD